MIFKAPREKPASGEVREAASPPSDGEALTLGEHTLYGRMSGWVASCLDNLIAHRPEGGRDGDSHWGDLVDEGFGHRETARNAAGGRPPKGGPRGLWRRIRSWMGRVRSWAHNRRPWVGRTEFFTAMDGLGGNMRRDVADLNSDLKGELHSLRQEMQQEIARLDGSLNGLLQGQARLHKGQVKIWGELGGQRGERFERLALDSTRRWMNLYSIERGIPTPHTELVWTDHAGMVQGWQEDWRTVARSLGVQETCTDILRCDMLLRVKWDGTDSDLRRTILVSGEVGTTMNSKRQRKVEGQFRALSAAGHTVLPVLFGLEHATIIDLPNQVDYQMDEDALVTSRHLVPPADLYPSLDRLLGMVA